MGILKDISAGSIIGSGLYFLVLPSLTCLSFLLYFFKQHRSWLILLILRHQLPPNRQLQYHLPQLLHAVWRISQYLKIIEKSLMLHAFFTSSAALSSFLSALRISAIPASSLRYSSSNSSGSRCALFTTLGFLISRLYPRL